jgi:Zn-dependent protease
VICATRPSQGTLVLVAPNARAVRASVKFAPLLPMLRAGVTIDEATKAIARASTTGTPSPAIRTSVRAFLAQIRCAALLDGAPLTTTSYAGRALYIVPSASFVVSRGLWNSVAAATLGLLLLLMSLLAAREVAALGGALTPSKIPATCSAAGALFFAFVAVPLHELGHAVACASLGARVSAIGVRFGKWGAPGPFVDTTLACVLPRRERRALIPLAGPLVDLAVFVTAAAVRRNVEDATLHAAATFVALLTLVTLVLALNPFLPSDGAHALEAIFSDEQLRRAAIRGQRGPFTRSSHVAIYRGCSAAYVVGLVLLVCIWARGAW